MAKLRTKDLADFEHYLQVRPVTELPKNRKRRFRRLTIMSAATTVVIAMCHAGIEVVALAAATFPISAGFWIATPDITKLSPDLEISLKADRASMIFRDLMQKRKLKSSMHAAVGILLNECAGFWRRIMAVNQQRVWTNEGIATHWTHSRAEWTTAANLAMAEVLVLGEAAITLSGPRSRTEDVIEEVFEAIAPGKNFSSPELLPVQFSEIREIADKLQILAREVESISRNLRAGPLPDDQKTASRRLEDVLGQMEAIRNAEEELHQRS